MEKFVVNSFVEGWRLAVQMTPYLIFGFAAAGVLRVLIPAKFVAKHLGGETKSSVLKAAALGVPLPLCSCGVLPVAASLRQAGAGKAPTLSFLIATPVTGIDSILATYALLGLPFAAARVAASFIIGLLTGFAQLLLGAKDKIDARHLGVETSEALRCGGGCEDGCGVADDGEEKKSRAAKLKEGLIYAFYELPSSVSGSLLLGLLIGGVITAAIPPDWFGGAAGSNLGGVLAAVAVGVPLYVCATGSIPIAAAMITAGMSPGAAMAFLLAGPSTNAVAFSTVKKILGAKSLAIYLVCIFAGSVAFGLTFDALLSAFPFLKEAQNAAHSCRKDAHTAFSAVEIIVAAFSLAVMTFYYAAGTAAFQRFRRAVKTKGKNKMSQSRKIALSVPDMSCAHCKKNVLEALSKLPCALAADVDLTSKRVEVEMKQDCDEAEILDALAKAGYNAKVV